MMSAMSLSQIARETGGQLTGDARIASISTDSRAIEPGDLFVALVGDTFDGNEFVAQVAEAGAAAAVVSEPNVAAVPQLVVADTRLALGQIARINRRQFSGPLIALTGSAGKTTCKEMIAGILSECGEVLATEGNLNNEIGVPLTLLRLEPRHEFAVVEMGASRADDIHYLTQFAEPTIALLTNAMAAHMDGFGDLQTVADTKGQILESVADHGVAIINIDDEFASQWQRQAGNATQITVSLLNDDADFYAKDIQLSAGGDQVIAATLFTLCTPAGSVVIRLNMLGQHNVRNAVAAAATAVAAGADLQQVKHGLEAVLPVKGRLQVHQLDGQVLIDDSYNANPQAVKAAIDVLAECKGSRCLVLGTMGEQGANAQQVHNDVVAYAEQRGINQLYMVGEFAAQATHQFGQAFFSMDDLLATISTGITADAVLVKGSRSAGMERAVQALIEHNKRGKG